MAASGQGESAPPFPGKAAPEEKPPPANHGERVQDVQHLQEERPTQPQGGSASLEQEGPHLPVVKKEEEELWITQEVECLLEQEEVDLTKLPLTIVSVKTEDAEDKQPVSLHRLCSSNVHHPIGYQEEALSKPHRVSCTLKEEDPQRPHVKKEEEELLTTQEGGHLLQPEEADLTKLPLTVVAVKTEDQKDKPPDTLQWLCPSDAQQLIGHQEERPPQIQGCSSTVKQEDPQPSHVKKEEEKLWTTQDGEHLQLEEVDLTRWPLAGVSVKTEDHEDNPPETSQLHHSPSKEKRGAVLSSSSSPQHMTTEVDGDHCGGSEADNLLAPLSDSDDTTSPSPEDEDRNDTREPLSSDTDWEGDMRTHADSKHSKCSKKKSCSVCAKSFSYKGNLSRHMLTHSGENPFSCSYCLKSFYLESNFTRHMLTHTREEPVCSVCGERFFRKTQLASHMRKHTGEKPFSCSVCPKRFSFQRDLTRHMWTHTGEKPFSCSRCTKRFSSKGEMARHTRSHTGEKPFKCSICPKSYLSKSDLSKHLLTHTGEKPFTCSVCDKSFPLKCQLTQHTIRHTGEKPFDCSVCGQKFYFKAQMVSHMRKHTGEKPFGCSVCSKSFICRYGLTRHMVTHTEKKSFICSVCDKSFLFKGDLTRHTLTHLEKPFVCSVCARSFLHKGDLDQHMLTHTGETPFCCSFCGKYFSSKRPLNRHMLTHTDKNFACSICNRKFYQEPQLVSHMGKHTGEKPFACSVCAKRFLYKRNLSRHMRHHASDLHTLSVDTDPKSQ